MHVLFPTQILWMEPHTQTHGHIVISILMMTSCISEWDCLTLWSLCLELISPTRTVPCSPGHLTVPSYTSSLLYTLQMGLSWLLVILCKGEKSILPFSMVFGRKPKPNELRSRSTSPSITGFSRLNLLVFTVANPILIESLLRGDIRMTV